MAIQGTVTTALQTVGVRIDMDDAIVLLPTWDVPLQQRIGTAPCNEVRIDWLEDTLVPDTATVTSFTGTGPWTVTTPDSSMLRVGDILHLKDGAFNLQYTVTSIADTTHYVITAFASGTTPTNGDVHEIIGQLNAEGSPPPSARSNDRTNPFNYTQIGQEAVAVTRTERKRGLYGVEDQYAYTLQKKFKELAIRFERSMVNGVAFQSGSTRFMGGLLNYITTNAQSGLVANSKSLLNTLAKQCYTNGGTPRTLYVSPNVKAALSANIDPTLRRVERSDTTGGFVVEQVLTDFGSFDVVVDRYLPKTKAILLQEEFVTRRVFDAYFHEYLAKTGDFDNGEVVAELSLEVKNQNAQGVLTLTDA